MYCTDAATGETRFELTKPASAREVFLECFSPRKKFRVPMVRERSRWTARVALPVARLLQGEAKSRPRGSPAAAHDPAQCSADRRQ